MPEIVLSQEQASILSSAAGLVAIRRPDGSFVGWVSPRTNFIIPNECPFTPEEVAAVELEANETSPWRSTQQVLERLCDGDPSQS